MRVFSLIICFALLALSCDKQASTVDHPYGNDGVSSSCEAVIISDIIFQEIMPNQATVTDLSIEDDCLTVTLGVSGCDADHTFIMISNGDISESLPPQITFDFLDEQTQYCTAYFLVERQFDLSPIRDVIKDDILITFRNSDFSILYEE